MTTDRRATDTDTVERSVTRHGLAIEASSLPALGGTRRASAFRGEYFES